MSESAATRCQFYRSTWECRGDGYLWDADSDGYDPDDTSHPCPCCNTLEYLKAAKEEAETVSHWSDMGYSGTGETIWINSLSWASSANPEAARLALAEIGPVHALVHDDSAPEGYVVSINNA